MKGHIIKRNPTEISPGDVVLVKGGTIPARIKAVPNVNTVTYEGLMNTKFEALEGYTHTEDVEVLYLVSTTTTQNPIIELSEDDYAFALERNIIDSYEVVSYDRHYNVGVIKREHNTLESTTKLVLSEARRLGHESGGVITISIGDLINLAQAIHNKTK